MRLGRVRGLPCRYIPVRTTASQIMFFLALLRLFHRLVLLL